MPGNSFVSHRRTLASHHPPSRRVHSLLIDLGFEYAAVLAVSYVQDERPLSLVALENVILRLLQFQEGNPRMSAYVYLFTHFLDRAYNSETIDISERVPFVQQSDDDIRTILDQLYVFTPLRRTHAALRETLALILYTLNNAGIRYQLFGF